MSRFGEPSAAFAGQAKIEHLGQGTDSLLPQARLDHGNVAAVIRDGVAKKYDALRRF